MKRVLILAALISVNMVILSCSNDDANEMKQSNAELQAINKKEVKIPSDKKD